MRQVVYKFPLSVSSNGIVNMPKGATILSVQMQDEVPTLWALCVPSNPYEDRLFFIVGTGHIFEPASDARFIGTVQTRNGLVWHIFEGVMTQ